MPYIFLHFTVNGPPAIDSDTDPFRAIALDAAVLSEADDPAALRTVRWGISPPVLPRTRKGKPYPGLPSAQVHDELLALRDEHQAHFVCWWGSYSQILLRLLARDGGREQIVLQDVSSSIGPIKGGDVALLFRDRQLISRGKTPGGRGRPPSTQPDLIYRAMGGVHETAPPIEKEVFIFRQMLQDKVADERVLKMAPKEDDEA